MKIDVGADWWQVRMISMLVRVCAVIGSQGGLWKYSEWQVWLWQFHCLLLKQLKDI